MVLSDRDPGGPVIDEPAPNNGVISRKHREKTRGLINETLLPVGSIGGNCPGD
jgi:hypothetical protein